LGESSREFRFGSLEGLVCWAHGQDMNVYGNGRDMFEAPLCIDTTTAEARVYLSHSIVDIEQPLKLRNGLDIGRIGCRSDQSDLY
jgi:hypothetical protein